MVTIRAKQTVADVFGKLNAGQTTQVDAEKAEELEKLGLVEIMTKDDGKPVPERKSKGVVISDHTESGGGKVLYESPQDKKDPPAGPIEEEVVDKVDNENVSEEEKVEEKENKVAEVSKKVQSETAKKQYGRK